MKRQRLVANSSCRPCRYGAVYLFAAYCCLIASGCVLRPTWQKLAVTGNLQEYWINTGQFRHLVLANNRPGTNLRIYVEGDGTPWIRGARVSVDPTPTNPVLLRLMRHAIHPAIYLGRPCYFGAASDKGCDQQWWTFGRYSKVVTESMCAAANRLSREFAADSVQLIGYSGGGAIVVAMRECTENLVAITTIAGNLDPMAWTDYHDYEALADQLPLQSTAPGSLEVPEAHWQCRNDSVVPPAITDRYFATHASAMRHLVDSCTHATGWETYWTQIIQ